MASCVVDASALMALLLEEPGADQVKAFLSGSAISTVNLCETLTRLSDKGIPTNAMTALINRFDISVQSFDDVDASAAAALRASTRKHGLSLGDRACLALAARLQVPAYTADSIWADLDIGIDVRLIR